MNSDPPGLPEGADLYVLLALTVGYSNLQIFASTGSIFGAIQQGDALNLMHRYYPLIKQEVQWQTIPLDKGAALRLDIEAGNPDQRRLMTELAFSNCFFMVKLLTGKALTAAELHLQYPTWLHS